MFGLCDLIFGLDTSCKSIQGQTEKGIVHFDPADIRKKVETPVKVFFPTVSGRQDLYLRESV